MGLFICMFLFALINLGVGFTLAVALGLGPTKFSNVWCGSFESRAGEDATVLSDGAGEVPSLPLSETRLEETLAHELASQTEATPLCDPCDENAAGSTAPPAGETWQLNEKYPETLILKLNIALMKRGARGSEIDTRLREGNQVPDAATVRACIDELKAEGEIYLSEQGEMALKLRERIEEFGEFKGLAEEIEASNLEEAAQVETTLSNLGHMDLSTDPEAARLRVLTEIGRLRVTRHKLRDRQEMAFLRISRHHNRLNEIAKPLLYDPLTELRSRIGLETQLWEWWQEGRHQSARWPRRSSTWTNSATSTRATARR